MQNTALFKMQIAIGHDKEGFKRAVMNKDTKAFAELMNFSEAEHKEFWAQYQKIGENFKIRFASKQHIFDKINKRYNTNCKSCQSSELNATDIDKQIEKVSRFNMPIGDKIMARDPNCPTATQQDEEASLIAAAAITAACVTYALLSVFGWWVSAGCIRWRRNDL